MDELTTHIQDDVPWCMSFADDIILIDATNVGANYKFEDTLNNLKDFCQATKE